MRVGDGASYIFAQPGNDTTHLLVLGIEGDKARCWDLYFNFEITTDIKDLGPLSEKQLDSKAWNNEQCTLRELLVRTRTTQSVRHD